jgi:hypothetical protein
VEVAAIREHWASGQARRAGSAIYEAISGPHRPAWAADILELSCSRLADVPAPVRAVAEIARDPLRWREAHAAFSAVRKLTLAEEKSHAGGVVYELVLFVAENAAKVVYNASGQPAPFDYDCGYWLVGCLRELVEAVGSLEFEQRAWGVLSAWLQQCGGSAEPVNDL